MSILRNRWLVAPLALGVLLAALAVLTLIFTQGTGSRVAADVPHAGLDYSMGVDTDGDGTDDCDSTAGPMKCTLAEGATFTVGVYLNDLGGIVDYEGVQVSLIYTGVTSKDNASTEAWPECAFAAASYTNAAGDPVVLWGCASFNNQSTYTGLIGTNDFNCAASGVITMIHSDIDTSVSSTGEHAEGDGTTEELQINCGDAPAATPTEDMPGATATPSGPTPTTGPATETPTESPATDTPTPAPPTETPTDTPVPEQPCGDANADDMVDSVDALWVLWLVADLIDSLPGEGDINGDGLVDARDALLILQIVAELYSCE